MSQLSKEKLISQGVKKVLEGKECYFYVSDIVKKYPDAKIQDADVHVKVVSGKNVKTVLIQDIKL